MNASAPKRTKTGFMGDSRLRKAGTDIPMTHEQMEIYKRCRNDYIYFIENFYYIQTLDQGEILFKMWDIQKEVIHTIHKNRRIIGMQSRQSGKTTIVGAYALWHVLFKRKKKASVGIVAHKASGARECLFRIKYAISKLPLWMQQGIRVWNVGNIEFENDGIIFTAATSKQGLRGNTASIIVCDEAAVVPTNIAEDFFTAIQPIISSGKDTKMILVSTPIGYNHFYHRWQAADKYDTKEKGTNGFVQFFIHWSQIPGRTQEWADGERKAIGDLKFNQEYDCVFLGSSLTLINSNTIGAMKAQKPIMENSEGLKIFHAPVHKEKNDKGEIVQQPHLYFGIVDVSRGVGGDYSALTIVDVTENPFKVVATYRNNLVSPLLFPSIIAKLGKDYNEAFLLVEVNENGQQIADILFDELEYENLLTVVKNGTRGQALSNGFGKRTGIQLGVKTSTQVKRLGCMAIKTIIEENKLLVEDEVIISEFTTFIEVRNSYEADQGYHDDMAMTLVLFGWMTTQQFFKDLTNESLRESIFKNRIDSINISMTPYFFHDGVEEFEQMDSMVYSGNIPVSEDIDDIRWLLAG